MKRAGCALYLINKALPVLLSSSTFFLSECCSLETGLSVLLWVFIAGRFPLCISLQGAVFPTVCVCPFGNTVLLCD